MSKILTSGEVVSKLRDLLRTNPAYIWGTNGEIVTPELIQNLKDRYVSNDHTPEYYDEKLQEYRGKQAVDNIGMLNFLSGENIWLGSPLSLQDYLYNAKQIIPAVDITENQVWVLFNIKSNGTPRIGIYLGNGNVIVANEGYPGMHEVNMEKSKWENAFIPHFMDSTPIPDKTSSIIEHYQTWLNEISVHYGLGTVPISGHYDAPTKTMSLVLAKLIYGELVGTSFDATAKITMPEIVSEIGHPLKLGYKVETYEKLMYIISMRLYVLKKFPNFIEVWGNSKIESMTYYGVRLSAMKHALKVYITNNRYLDSIGVGLPLLRELFYDISA